VRVALDTNRYADLAKAVPDVVEVVRQAEAVVLPFVVVGELRAGFLCGTRRAENEGTLEKMLASPLVSVAYADDQTTRRYAALFAQSAQRGLKVPANDLWIAAIVEQHGLMLYTRDTHFDRLPHLPRV
jgi:tRNA(fMet)-specific endonuclease VapC